MRVFVCVCFILQRKKNERYFVVVTLLSGHNLAVRDRSGKFNCALCHTVNAFISEPFISEPYDSLHFEAKSHVILKEDNETDRLGWW